MPYKKKLRIKMIQEGFGYGVNQVLENHIMSELKKRNYMSRPKINGGMDTKVKMQY